MNPSKRVVRPFRHNASGLDAALWAMWVKLPSGFPEYSNTTRRLIGVR